MNRNRLFMLAVALAVAVVVIATLVAVGAGKDSKHSVTAPSGTSAHAHPFRGVPQHGDTLGDPAAPVSLTVFEDPQCPFCRDWNVNTLPSVIDEFVRPGKVKLVFRGINIIGPNSEVGLRAIYAAGQQNKLWNVAAGLYAAQGAENSGWITDALIRQVAAAAGANAGTVLADASMRAVTAQLARAAREADADGVRGTPTFILQRPLAEPVQLSAPLDAAGFGSALTAALR
jgi:protein-disulfide isomerase